jgi:transketolase
LEDTPLPALPVGIEADVARAYPELRRRVRLRLLRMHHESRVGHIGGNLSCLDILLVLHHYALGADDQFVLSKGHAAGALYATLASLGHIPDEELATFHKDGTRLSGHPPVRGLPGVAFATGSLGHGLSLAAGLALARRLRGQDGRVFCLTSDGEWNEGSCWEALIFARHHGLTNLTVLVDLNGLQGFGTTRDVADLEPFADKLRTFGFTVAEVDGHDPVALVRALKRDGAVNRAVVCRTRKGCGVSFMEGRMEWHYLPMSPEQYRQAVAENE